MRKDAIEEQILRASKEIVVKFIEVGRLTPSNFGKVFTDVYQAIDATVKGTPDGVSGCDTNP